MKRTTLCSFLLSMLCVTTAWADFSGGSGTQSAPYLIGTSDGKNLLEDLNTLRTNVNNGTTYSGVYFKIGAYAPYELVDDNWTPIGSDPSHPFMGHFDGNGNTFAITITGDVKYAGFFGVIKGTSSNNAEVTNLNFKYTDIDITAKKTDYSAGAVAGVVQAYSNITNCTVNQSEISINAYSVSAYCFSAGGLVGMFNDGRMEGNTVLGTSVSVQSDTNYQSNRNRVGGLAAYVTSIDNFSNNFVAVSSLSATGATYYYKGAIAGIVLATSSEPSSNYWYSSDNSLTGLGRFDGHANTYGNTRVIKINCPNGLAVSSTPTITKNGTNYYEVGSTASVQITDPFYSLCTAPQTTKGSISNVTVYQPLSATFTVGNSGDITFNDYCLEVLYYGDTGDGLHWSLSGDGYHELTITGNGVMPNYEYTTVDGLWRTKAPWGWHITKVTIGDGVTSIGSYAFVGCQQLGSITIGSSVGTIGQSAFDRCDASTEITLPASVNAIAGGAFAQCKGLKRINIMNPEAVTLSNSNVFTGCDVLQYIVFPSISVAQANTSGNWSGYTSKFRALLGSQHFGVNTDGGTPAYAIANETDLRNLSTVVNGGTNGSGLTFRQTANISVSGNFTPIGSSQTNYFGGTYDGNGKTLTVNISDTENMGTALFRNIQGATIKNLLLSGSVSGTIHAAALVGFSRGTNTIDRCKVASNVTVTTPHGSNYHCGGVVGHALSSNLTISNTVYCGTITNSGSFVGGLQGWCDGGSTLTVQNSLFAGSYQGTTTGTASFHPIAVRNKNVSTTVTETNTYFEVFPTLTDYSYIDADGKKTTAVTSAPSNLGSSVQTLSYMTVYQNGILFNGNYYAAPVLSTNSSGEYLINNTANWNAFCDMLYDNNTYNRFSGKTVKLGASITVTRMAGSSNHDFCGTFDGDGKTLTFNYGSSTAPTAEEYVAPFRYVSNATPVGGSAESPATFKNLNVAGTIYTSAKYAAGIVAQEWGTVNIKNCHVSTTINSSVDGDGTHGGFVGVQNGALTIRGCVFDGQLLGSSTNACGGIVGFRSKGDTNIYHTLFAPTALTIGTTNSATFVRNASASCHEGCYYTQPFNDGTNNLTSQGSIAVLVGGNKPGNIGIAGTNYGMVQAYTYGLKYNDNYCLSSRSDLTFDAAGTAYTISSNEGWNLFCAVLASNAQGFFTGKTVTLNAGVTASIMAGDNNHRFTGTFDGGGKTLTVAYGTGSKRLSDQYAAPFRYVDGGTIKNLRVTGTIYTSAKYAAGYVANAQGNTSITNSVSSVTIDSSVSGDGTHGGFVGAQSGELTIEGCVFNGSLLGSSTNACGGFVGWRGGTVNISNSLFAPVSVTIGTSDSYTFSRRSGSNISKCYSTQAFGTAQGTLARNVTAGDQYVTTCTVSPIGNSTAPYNVSDIAVYTYGIERDGTYYYGNGDQVNLTLAHSNRTGYTFDKYVFSAGTISNTTLTMPDANVTVTTVWKLINYSITYVLNGGVLPGGTPTSYTIESNDITLVTPTRDGYRFDGWYANANFTGTPVSGIATGNYGERTFYAKWTLLATLFAANAANDWMTWCSQKEWTIDDSQATVYTLGAVANGTVTLTQLADATVIPAYVPVLIQRKPQVTSEVVATFSHDGDPNSLDAAPYSYTSLAYLANCGAVTAQTDDACFYGNPGTLSVAVDNLQGYNADTYTLFALYNGTFLRVGTTNGGIHPNRCLLAVANSALNGTTATRLNINFADSETTGISEAEANSSLFILHSSFPEWYTLDGRKLDSKPTRPGVYIYNGKKQVIKK